MEEIAYDFLLLVKFGQRAHLEEFRSKGLLYMNSAEYFRKIEGDMVRRDIHEGIDRVFQPSFVKTLTFGDPKSGGFVLTSKDLAGPVTVRLPGYHSNLFCLYAIENPDRTFSVDERNFELGDSFVLIKNTQTFIDLVLQKALDSDLQINACLVEYFGAKTYSGEVGSCKKSDEFSYQNEFRFILHPGSSEPLTIKLGDITKITTPVLPLSEINTGLKFNFSEI